MGGSVTVTPIGDEDASAHLYRSMFENAIWGIFQTTADGRYLTANPALARIYGYPSPEAMLTALVDIGRQLYVEPTRRDEFIALMRAHGHLSGFESAVYRRDGEVIWISESCREVRDQAGRLLYFEGTVEEITQRKRAAADLEAAKRLAEDASKAKSIFLANMSHELRTPLNAVLGFSEVLRDELFGPLGNDRYRDYARDIHASGRHLLEVINNILDLTRIETGNLPIDEEEVEVGALMASCERIISGPAQKQRIRLGVVPPEGQLLLRADATRVKQILLNLLSNAIKFTPPGNRVMMTATLAAEEDLLLAVADTGIGMRADEIETAFQPFRQLDGSLARRYDGAGLGLTLTRSLVELHDGSLTLVSAPGQGTTATVRLPRCRVRRN